ncbi:MAG: PDZ domain-containing protein [Deltaproteobacteria bacterium]|nr:MAG: PDZ domain-containing protein [Deltaproteobacteria bacterium]
MRRRALPIAAVALAGLFVGAWLSWSPSGDRWVPPPRRPGAAPAPAPVPEPITAPAADDTGPPPPRAVVTANDPEEEELPEPGDLLPVAWVRCALEGDDFDDLEVVARGTGALWASARAQDLAGELSDARLAAIQARPLRWRTHGDRLEVEAPVGTPLLTFTIRRGDREHHATMSLRWSGDAGECQSALRTVPPRRIHLAGRVEGVVEGDDVWLVGCSLDRRLGDTDRFDSTVTLPDRPCELFATRVDGLIRVRGDGVEIDPRDGDRTDIVLSLPDYDVGGIGAVVEFDPEGLRLGALHAGSPAEAAGLSEGDIVLEADGEPLAGRPMVDMIAAVTGEVGSTVQLRVRGADGEERLVEVERAWIGE